MYLNGEIMDYKAQKEFVEKILGPLKVQNQTEAVTPATEALDKTEIFNVNKGKTKCCSIF